VILALRTDDEAIDVNTKDSNQCTPLIVAARRGKLEIIKFLLFRGADIEASDHVCSASKIIA